MARLNPTLSLLRAVCLSAALFMLGSLLPVLGAMLVLCAPAPLLIEVLGRPDAPSRMALGLAVLLGLVGLAVGPAQGLGFALTLGLGIAVMFVMLRRQASFESIVLVGAAAMMAAGTAALLIWAGSPAAMVHGVQATLTAAMNHADKFYKEVGLNVADAKEINGRILAVTLSLVPALAILMGGIAILLNLGLVWRWLGSERLGYALFGGLARWRTPEWLVWFLLAAGFGMFMPNEPFKVAATNAFLLVSAVYFCQGLAIMAYYFQKLAMPVPARGLIYMIALVQPVLAVVVCLAGIFDLWIDFRRLKPPSPEAGSFDDFF